MTTPTEIKLAKGLIAIAELAMPDTYFASDSRVNLARKVLAKAKAEKSKKKNGR